MKMWNMTITCNVKCDNDDDYNEGQQTNFDQKSSLEPLAQVSIKLEKFNFLNYIIIQETTRGVNKDFSKYFYCRKVLLLKVLW